MSERVKRKRGRHREDTPEDAVLARRREVGRARQKRYYDRQRLQKRKDDLGALTLVQEEAADAVVATSSVADVTPTLLETGIHVQDDIEVPSDPSILTRYKGSRRHDGPNASLSRDLSWEYPISREHRNALADDGESEDEAAAPDPVQSAPPDFEDDFIFEEDDAAQSGDDLPDSSPRWDSSDQESDHQVDGVQGMQPTMDDAGSNAVRVRTTNPERQPDSAAASPLGLSPVGHDDDHQHVRDSAGQDDGPAGSQGIADSDDEFEPLFERVLPETNPASPADQPPDNEGAPLEGRHDDAADAPYEDGRLEEQEDPVDRIARRLISQLIEGHHGCDQAIHDAALSRHRDAVGEDTHCDLRSIYSGTNLPTVLASPTSLNMRDVGQDVLPSPTDWQAAFLGTKDPGSWSPKHVCLHEHTPDPAVPSCTFDVDSFMGFATSLAFARKGLDIQPIPLFHQHLKTDMHISMQSFTTQGVGEEATLHRRETQLRKVPHLHLGRLSGSSEVAVYLFFPHLPFEGEEFRAMSSAQLERWLDKIFLPALAKAYPRDYMQHLPASYEQAYLETRAGQWEQRSTAGKGYDAQAQLVYPLQPQGLELLWTEINQTIDSFPGLSDFRAPELFFNAKGTKLTYKSVNANRTLSHTLLSFGEALEAIVDMDCIDVRRMFVDIGKEICPPAARGIAHTRGVGTEAQVLSWRRCCLESYLTFMYPEQRLAPSSPARRFYQQHFLRDACSLTSLSPKRSENRQAGLVYSQFYSSCKEVFDSRQLYPFENEALEELAMDPSVRAAILQAQKNTARRNLAPVHAAYLASKARTHAAIMANRNGSFGVREEHRVDWSLLMAIIEALSDRDDGCPELDAHPPYVWAIRSDVYFDFVYRTADKYCAGFEVVRARCNPKFVTVAETKMMLVFLRCLRFALGAHQLSRETALWCSTREAAPAEGQYSRRMFHGLGFSNTIARYGFAWLEDRFDWQYPRFKAAFSRDSLFGNGVLWKMYSDGASAVKGYIYRTEQLDGALQLLRAYQTRPRLFRILVDWMAHIVLVEFRDNVITAASREIDPERLNDIRAERAGLCRDYFREIFDGRFHFAGGNRSGKMTAQEIFDRLFSPRRCYARKHWEEIQYRGLFGRAAAMVNEFSLAEGRGFLHRVKHFLFKYHWALPNVDHNVFTHTDKNGSRQYLAIKYNPDTGECTWVKGNAVAGRPPEPPEWTYRGVEAVRRWMERLAPDMVD